MSIKQVTLNAAASHRVLPFVPQGGLTFGIYHGGVVESPNELASGKPDLPDEVNRALDRLQSGRHFLVRTYIRFTGLDMDSAAKNMPSVADLARYTWNGRKLDLVLSNWDRTGNMSRWSSFIEYVIERYGEYVQNLQICEEPNLFDYPGDGRFGHSVEAVLVGIRTAREILRKRELCAAIGFNAVPTCIQNDGFWQGISKQIDAGFLNALDYVGLNMYLDVAEPLVGAVEDAVEEKLTHFRNVSLAEAGIPANIPLHICENGWPTGPNRFYTRQADILESIVIKVYELRNTLNITQFELFSLRDADTANPEIRRQFGIMRDDYTPKPAFETYRRLIQELGS
jgi:hypothetical protein